VVIIPANHQITPPIKRNHTQYPIVLFPMILPSFLLLPITVL
jgi:hypothetical protein